MRKMTNSGGKYGTHGAAEDTRETETGRGMHEPALSELERELDRVEYRSRYYKVLRGTLYTLLIAAAVAVLAANLWMPVLQVVGSSMTPTLGEGDVIVAIKGRNFSDGSVTAFYYGNRVLIKRCVAGPGDWVYIDGDGNVNVNGVQLDEPYVSEKSLGDCNIQFPYQVPEGRYFLLGDHRATSVDSRNTAVGCVNTEQIVGKVVLRIWPLNKIGVIQ